MSQILQTVSKCLKPVMPKLLENIDYTAKVQFITQSPIVQVLSVFSLVILQLFKCRQFHKGNLDFSFEFIQLHVLDKIFLNNGI